MARFEPVKSARAAKSDRVSSHSLSLRIPLRQRDFCGGLRREEIHDHLSFVGVCIDQALVSATTWVRKIPSASARSRARISERLASTRLSAARTWV
jgi:hypothetical protein